MKVDDASGHYVNYSLIPFNAKSGDTLIFENKSSVNINILAKGEDNSNLILVGVTSGKKMRFTLDSNIISLGVYNTTTSTTDILCDVYRTDFLDILAGGIGLIKPSYGRDKCNDLDDAPNNSILSFTSLSDVSHSPIQSAATVLTYNTENAELPSANKIQILIECGVANPAMYIRAAYGSPLNWSNWNRCDNTTIVNTLNDVIDDIHSLNDYIEVSSSLTSQQAKYSIKEFHAKNGEQLTFFNKGININILAKGEDDSNIILGAVASGITGTFTLTKDIKALGAYNLSTTPGDALYEVIRTKSKTILNDFGGIIPDTTRDNCDDLNNAPINSILAFTTLSGVANTPTYEAATLLTYNVVVGALPKANIIQILTECGTVSLKRIYFRSAYANPLVWNDWKEITSTNDRIYKASAESGYYSYNLIPYSAKVGDKLFIKNDGVRINLLATLTDSTTKIIKGGVLSGYSTITLEDNIKSLGVFTLEAGKVDIKVLSALNAEMSNKQDIEFSSLSCFLRIGVIGDSYASGWLDVSGSAVDWYNISWIQQIARMNGVTGVNFSKGGLTTRSWLTDAKGLTKLNAEDACDLYYIVLGINDAYSLGVDYLGTIADCTDTPQSNPDTFYGNFGKILDDIATKAPHAKVIISTMAHSDNTADKFNNAIVEIANHFELPLIIQREDAFFTSNYWNNNKVSGHPSVQLYGGMAKAIERLTLRCMVENASYFNDIWPSSEPS